MHTHHELQYDLLWIVQVTRRFVCSFTPLIEKSPVQRIHIIKAPESLIFCIRLIYAGSNTVNKKRGTIFMIVIPNGTEESNLNKTKTRPPLSIIFLASREVGKCVTESRAMSSVIKYRHLQYQLARSLEGAPSMT